MLGVFRKSGSTLPKPQIKQCSICGVSGTPRGSYGLHRPLCCQPISVCKNCSKRKLDILTAFRDVNRHCAEHSIAKIAEVEYIDPYNTTRKFW